MRIRVFLIDDQAIYRHGLSVLLAREQDLDVIGECASDERLCALLGAVRPDVVLLDTGMDGEGGIQQVREIAQAMPTARLVVLSNYRDVKHMLHALDAGAHAYLLKNTSHDKLVQAIRAVYRGQRLLAPEMMPFIVDGYGHLLVQGAAPADTRLSLQEIDILQLLASGATSRDIAERMFWSEVTVKRKVRTIEDKLSASNRVHAVATALRLGII